MRASRGMGDINPAKEPKANTALKKGGKVMEKESKSEERMEESKDKKQDVAMIKKAYQNRIKTVSNQNRIIIE